MTDEEQLLWSELENDYAPFVLSDRFGDDEELAPPNINECAWVSLYALSILVLLRMRGQLPLVYEPPVAPNIPRSIVTDFWRKRKQQVSAFAWFLHSWGLGGLFGVPEERFPVDFRPQWATDQRVLGYHSFAKLEAVQSYVLRWKENAEIAATEILYHRLVASRGIDLICSELISNGFEHASSGSGVPVVFTMAKLCTAKSCWVALQLDKERHHLCSSERTYFENAVAGDYPVLQLVIADSGHGFAGNNALQRLYDEQSDGRSATELELIEFALLPEVSTKLFSEQAATEWARYLDDMANVRPVIHGLSEVLLYIKEMHGYWRIHSNNSVLEYDFSSDVAREMTNDKTRNVFGCLHYLMFPLPTRTAPRAAKPSTLIDSTKCVVIDAAEEVLSNPPKPVPDLSADEWRDGMVKLCKFILSVSGHKPPPPVLLNLSLLDAAPPALVHELFALLADTLHRARAKAAILISGASELTRSFLKRYQGMQKFFFDRRVLPFVAIHESSADEIEVRVECGESLQPINDHLNAALSPFHYLDILRSDHQNIWHLFEEVVHHNEGLFSIYAAGDQDYRFDGRVKVAPEDTRSGRLLLGGRSSKEFISKLVQHQGLIKGKFMRLGESFETYIHMGRLWADREYVSQMVTWLAVALQSALKSPRIGVESTNGASGTPWRDLDIVAVLHPAIDLAHGLAAHPVLREVSLTEVRRLGDIRWDFLPLLRLAGHRNVVCLVDILYKGQTANRLLNQLVYLGARPAAILSILNFGIFQPAVEIPVIAFTQCTKQDIDRASIGAL